MIYLDDAMDEPIMIGDTGDTCRQKPERERERYIEKETIRVYSFAKTTEDSNTNENDHRPKPIILSRIHHSDRRHITQPREHGTDGRIGWG